VARISSGIDYKNFFGADLISNPNWRGLVCDQCGHVQIFRIESASRRKDWWKDTK
jgi:hypothetical protein